MFKFELIVPYSQFVYTVTSEESQSVEALNARIQSIDFELDLSDSDLTGLEDHQKVSRVSALLTAGLGLPSESGEFAEIVKKIVFQGKPINEENIFHLKRELGDILWYVQQACFALNCTISDVIEMNREKLAARYAQCRFTVEESENRVEGDV